MAERLTREEQENIVQEASFKVKLSYSAGIIPFEEAKELALQKLPRTKEIVGNIQRATTGQELENIIKEAGLTLLVEKDFAEDLMKAQRPPHLARNLSLQNKGHNQHVDGQSLDKRTTNNHGSLNSVPGLWLTSNRFHRR